MDENVKAKKYYWLKLKNDFFERPEIRYVEAMSEGKDYILFYLKLLCKSIEHEGMLRFNDNIPYNIDMLSVITNTQKEIIENAISVFISFQMMELMDDGTYFMREVENMMGSETYWAERKREQRAKKAQGKEDTGQCPTIVQDMSNVSKEEREIELKKDLNTEREKENNAPSPSDEGWIEWAWGKIKGVYPRKDGAEAAKPQFIKLMEQTKIEDRDSVAHRLFNAVILYRIDYDKTRKDDAGIYTFVRSFSRWFNEDFDEWMKNAEEYEKERAKAEQTQEPEEHNGEE